MNIGKRIYYETESGNIILDTGEKQGHVKQTSVEYDFNSYSVLKNRSSETIGIIELDYGQYAQDFAECNGYRVNPETKELEFSYPDPNEEEPQEPAYQKSLSEEVEELRQIIDVLLGGEDNE